MSIKNLKNLLRDSYHKRRKERRIKSHEIMQKIFSVFVLCGFIIMGFGGGCIVQTAIDYSEISYLNSMKQLTDSISQETYIHRDNVKDVLTMTINYNRNIQNGYALLINGFVLILFCELFVMESENQIKKLKKQKSR